MGLQIEDGTGSGNSLKVDSQGRALIRSVTETHDFHVNHDNGKTWSLPFGPRDPTDVNDYVFYLKNTGDKDIGVTDIRISATGAASQIQINGVTGTAATGTTITPVSRRLGSPEIPSATAEDGVNITGLTSSGTLFYMEITAVGTLYHLSTSSNIILPKGFAIGISVAVATSIVTGIVSITELE